MVINIRKSNGTGNPKIMEITGTNVLHALESDLRINLNEMTDKIIPIIEQMVPRMRNTPLRK